MADTASPHLKAPPGACDCHTHIFDGRFPLAELPWDVLDWAPVESTRNRILADNPAQLYGLPAWSKDSEFRLPER